MTRDKTIDIIKCLGIVLMVLGHSGFIYTRWIYQFHMALFFIIAGYCFKERYSESLSSLTKLVIGRLKSLYIPCLLFNSFIVIFHNLFIKLYLISGEQYTIKTTAIHLIKCLLFSGGESLSGAMWFLRTMFISTILFGIVHFIFKKNELMRVAICFILTYIGYILSNLSFGKYFSFFSVMFLFELGFIIKTNANSLNLTGYKKHLFALIGLLGTIIPLYFVKDSISLKSNSIINPFYFVFCSLMGYIFIYSLSRMLKDTKISNVLAYIGNHTLPIVMFHYLSMKIVTLIGIVYFNDSLTKLIEYPFAYSGIFWCLLYTIVGITVPIIIYIPYSKLKNIIRSKIKIRKEVQI